MQDRRDLKDTGRTRLSKKSETQEEQKTESTGKSHTLMGDTTPAAAAASERTGSGVTDVPTAAARLKAQQEAFDGLSKRLESSRASVDEIEGRLKSFKASATRYQSDRRLGSDPIITTAYDRSVQQYNDLLPSYKKAVQDHNTLVGQYNAAREQYGTDYDAYRSLLSGQKAAARDYITQVEALEEEAKRLTSQAALTRRESSGGRSREGSGTRDQQVRQNQAEAEKKRQEAARLRQKAEEAEGYYYSSIPLAEDYAEKSKAAGSKAGGLFYITEDQRGDWKYDFINDIDQGGIGMRNMIQGMNPWAGKGGKYGEYTPYTHMTEDEIGVYNYLYATQGKEEVETYLDKLANTLNYRLGTENYENMNGLQKSLYWIPQGLDQFATGIGQLFSKDALPTSPTQYAGSMIQREAAELGADRNASGQVQYDENGKMIGQSLLGKVASGAYGLGTTVSNMAPSILVSYLTGGLTGGAVASGTMSAATAGQLAGAAGSAAMGASAAGNAYKLKLDEGWTPDQARSYATLVGLSESTLQHVLGGISALGGGSSLGDRALTKILGQVAKVDNALAKTALNFGARLAVRGLGEGIEEGLQEVLEPAFATLITGQDYEVDAGDVAYAFIMGYLASNVFEAPGALRAATAPAALTTLQFNSTGLNSYLGADSVDYFDGCRSAEEVKTRYRELAWKNHPDVGGDGTVMAEINRQRDIQDAFYRGAQKAAETAQRTEEDPTGAQRSGSGWERRKNGASGYPADSRMEQSGVSSDALEGLSLPTLDEAGSQTNPIFDDWPEGFAEVVRQQLMGEMPENISQPGANSSITPTGLSLPTPDEAGSQTNPIFDDWPEGFAEEIRRQLMGEMSENTSQPVTNPSITPTGLSLPTPDEVRSQTNPIFDDWPEGFAEAIRQQLMGGMSENILHEMDTERIDRKILLTDSLGDGTLESPEDEIVIGKSLGAAAFRDQVKLPDGRTVKIAEGSKITKVHTFAGYGAKKPVKVAVMLAKEYSVDKERWTHRRGDGYIEVDGESKHAELHWFEHPDVGRVKMKVKRYFEDEG